MERELSPDMYHVKWIPMILTSSWVAYDADLHWAPAYTKTPDGFVHLRGLMKSGTVSAFNAFTNLPPDFRPYRRLLVPATCDTNAGQAIVEADGDCFAVMGTNGYFSLNGILFDTRP